MIPTWSDDEHAVVDTLERMAHSRRVIVAAWLAPVGFVLVFPDPWFQRALMVEMGFILLMHVAATRPESSDRWEEP